MSAAPWSTPGDGYGVNRQLTSNTDPGTAGKGKRRRRREVENDDYIRFCRRIIHAAGTRVAAGDVEGLPDLISLALEVEEAITVAVTGLRDFGYSWADIASRLGTTRQNAQQRWGTPSTPGELDDSTGGERRG